MSLEIKEYIKGKRPNLSPSSIITYASILKSLYKKTFDDDDFDINKFNKPYKVLEVLKNLPFNKRKTILSALVVITDNKEYRELMGADIKEYNEHISTQEKSESQNENWVTTEEVNSIYNELKRNADLIYKKSNKTTADLQQIQNYIIISLLGGMYISPRRSKDYVDFKIKKIDKQRDNYMEKKKLVFNSYKTAKTYGMQDIDLPLSLQKILNKWIAINPSDFLLFDINNNQLSAVKLNQRINRIFDAKVSVNLLRHSYLTDKFGYTIEQKTKIDNTMENMGSSANMLKTYVKK